MADREIDDLGLPIHAKENKPKSFLIGEEKEKKPLFKQAEGVDLITGVPYGREFGKKPQTNEVFIIPSKKPQYPD